MTKYDAEHNWVWTRQFGAEAIGYASGIASATDGSLFVAGETEGSLFSSPLGTDTSDAFVVQFH